MKLSGNSKNFVTKIQKELFHYLAFVVLKKTYISIALLLSSGAMKDYRSPI
jgi:hypothetical protein